MSQVWQLVRVQQIDNQVADNLKKLEELDPGENVLKELEELQAACLEAAGDLRKKQASLKDKDLEVQKIVTQIKSFEKKLYSGDSKNPKELSGWQQEIDNLKKSQSTIEDEMLFLMEEIEAAEAGINEQDKAIGQKKEEHQNVQKSFLETTDKLKQENENLAMKREKFMETLDKDLWNKYQDLKEQKDGLAIAKISKGFCGGCLMNLPESVIKRVQQRTLEFCSNCGRILYTDGE